jgi:hypothetical protein
MLVPSAYRVAVILRTAFAKSYSGLIVSASILAAVPFPGFLHIVSLISNRQLSTND